jgi:hypothetical protein
MVRKLLSGVVSLFALAAMLTVAAAPARAGYPSGYYQGYKYPKYPKYYKNYSSYRTPYYRGYGKNYGGYNKYYGGYNKYYGGYKNYGGYNKYPKYGRYYRR